MHKIRVLIVDDHPLYRDGVRGVLDVIPDMEVVGEAATGEEAIRLASLISPDIILLDIHMPGMDGIAATRVIKAQVPQTQIIFLTQLDDKLVPGIQAGASGYMIKNTVRTQLVEAIRQVAAGNTYLHASVHNMAVAAIRQEHLKLTDTEREVLQLIAKGCTNKAIADELGYGLTWVKDIISSILAKLEVTDRTSAVTNAIARGLITPQ